MRQHLRQVLRGLLFLCAVGGTAFGVTKANDWLESRKVPEVEVITFDPGGSIYAFYEQYSKNRRDGTRVEIDGICISACTMSVALLPPDQICATPYARLAFHSASAGGKHSPEGTKLLWAIYTPAMRTLLKSKGFDGGVGQEHEDLIFVEGDELHQLVQPCETEE